MSRKRNAKLQPVPVPEAVPEEIIAEGSGAQTAEFVTSSGAHGDVQAELAALASVEPEAEAMPSDEPRDEAEALSGDAVDAVDAADDQPVDDPALELAATLPTSAASMDSVQLKQLVEALIFASDKPITVQRLRQLTRVSEIRRLEQALAELTEDYRERGLIVQQVSGGYQFRTRTQFSGWVQQLIAGRPVRLSRAQLETLAIIAYRQPITRPEIDDIRGVDSSGTLKVLLDRALIRILGKREEVGRPMLYGTTKEFLDFFSLGDLRELPTLREYSELSDESRKVMSDRLGIAPEGGRVEDTAVAPPDAAPDGAPDAAAPATSFDAEPIVVAEADHAPSQDDQRQGWEAVLDEACLADDDAVVAVREAEADVEAADVEAAVASVVADAVADATHSADAVEPPAE